MLTIQPVLSNTSIKEHLNLDYKAIKRLKSVSFWQEKWDTILFFIIDPNVFIS